MTGHFLTVTISPKAYGISTTIECREPFDATCRTNCSGDCESWSYSDDRRHCANCGKPLTFGGDCNPKTWIENDDLEGVFTGPEDTPYASGEIVFEWEGDFYTWDYGHAPEPDKTLPLFEGVPL